VSEVLEEAVHEAMVGQTVEDGRVVGEVHPAGETLQHRNPDVSARRQILPLLVQQLQHCPLLLHRPFPCDLPGTLVDHQSRVVQLASNVFQHFKVAAELGAIRLMVLGLQWLQVVLQGDGLERSLVDVDVSQRETDVLGGGGVAQPR
jgi:hypothetical protein